MIYIFIRTMAIDDQTLQEILLKQNYITADDVKRGEQYLKKNRGTLVEFLLAEDLVTKDLIGQATAESLGVPYADLNSYEPTDEQVMKIPEAVARQYRVALFREDAKQLLLTTDNPGAEGLKEALQKLFPKPPVTIAYSLSEDIDTVLVRYRKKLAMRFTEIIKVSRRVAPEIIDAIIEDALAYKTSDIHLRLLEA